MGCVQKNKQHQNIFASVLFNKIIHYNFMIQNGCLKRQLVYNNYWLRANTFKKIDYLIHFMRSSYKFHCTGLVNVPVDIKNGLF